MSIEKEESFKRTQESAMQTLWLISPFIFVGIPVGITMLWLLSKPVMIAKKLSKSVI